MLKGFLTPAIAISFIYLPICLQLTNLQKQHTHAYTKIARQLANYCQIYSNTANKYVKTKKYVKKRFGMYQRTITRN